VTSVELSALQASSLVQDAREAQPLPSHTVVRTNGTSVPVRLRQQFKSRFGTPLFINYGTLEFGRISSTFPDPVDDDLESNGVPARGIDFEIVDGDGNVVPAGQIGEVRVRSESMPHEYYRDPVATARHFKDGWFYPGDLGSLTPRGALCVYGRSDEMINLSGIKIFPAEIERALEDHAAVKSAAAFAKASAAYGDIPVAAVELHESATVAADELLAHARTLLGVRAPRKIIVLASLPRNSAGKVLKRELAALLEQAR
jgi:acyl-CoA synthetase (AMP-forming)/AMP-acid ligase II